MRWEKEGTQGEKAKKRNIDERGKISKKERIMKMKVTSENIHTKDGRRPHERYHN
jgi:hypothetical protein